MSQGRTFVIGDVHGCIEELQRLLDAIAPSRDDTVCFLGDYIDRGPSPKAVVERLIRLQAEGPQCVFLKGNHEDMFLSYLGYDGHYGESFLANGGMSTLVTYGVEDLWGQGAASRIPASHLEFYLTLSSLACFGRFLCVHAGVRPTRALEEQDEEDLFWIREDFIRAEHPFPYTIVFGHTPQRDVLCRFPEKIGLDTGLVYGNKLSCLEIQSARLFQVRRGAKTVLDRSLTGVESSICSP